MVHTYPVVDGDSRFVIKFYNSVNHDRLKIK